ncbi:MAG: TonB-dependent receptor [Gemmatimonadota bacterium]|nr:TonB-dependent receptor [Gemmatimonadota bacterium]
MISPSIIRTLFIVFLLSFAGYVSGQDPQVSVRGRVYSDKGTPLPSVNVYLHGTMIGAFTDEQGFYQISAPRTKEGYTFVFSHIGYENQKRKVRKVGSQSLVIDVRLKPVLLEHRSITVTDHALNGDEETGVTLTPLEIVTTAGSYADVFRTIQTFPGVQQVGDDAGLYVRGGDVSETAVVLDGAYLYHPYRFESPNGGFTGTVSPFLLKGTYFSSGGYGVEYGNALSGVLSMQSRDMPERFGIRMGLGLASYSAQLEIPVVHEVLGLSVSGNYGDTHYLYRFNGTSQVFSKYPVSYDFNLNWTYRYAPGGTFKLFYFRDSDDIGVEIVQPGDPLHYKGNSRQNFMNLRWRQLAGERLMFTGNVAFTDYGHRKQIGMLDLDSEDRLYQLRLRGEYVWKHVRVHAGFESYEHRHYLSGQIPVDPTSAELNPRLDVSHLDTGYRSTRLASFVGLNGKWAGRIGFAGGLRHEQIMSTNERALDPRFRITLPLSAGWNALISIGTYHQFHNPSRQTKLVEQSLLKAMKSTHYITGLNFQNEDSMYRLEVYRKIYTRLPLNDMNPRNLNGGHGYSQGVDVFMKRDWNRLSGRISYSYIKTQRLWEEAPHLASTRFDITNNLNLVADMAIALNFRLGLSYRYATGKPYTSGPHTYHDQRLPSYRRLDLNLTFLHRFLGSKPDVFYLSVANVLGRENILDYIYSRDFLRRSTVRSSTLRTVYFGLSINL